MRRPALTSDPGLELLFFLQLGGDRFGLPAGFDVYDDAYQESGRSAEFEMPERRADEVVALARKWIATQQGKWFAWVHVYDPHAT